MLNVNRRGVAEPACLKSERAAAAFAGAKKFYERPFRSRIQDRHKFDDKLTGHPEVRQALSELFHGKCAYCEREVMRAGASFIDHFRPMGGAFGRGANFDPDHYWWLAYDWRNLYLSCVECDFTKASRFPVKGERAAVPKGKRAQFCAAHFTEELQKEDALLLDPCAEFDLDEHLLFDPKTGAAVGLSEKGRATVEVFNLNRLELAQARQQNLGDTLAILKGLAALKKLRARQKQAPDFTLEDLERRQAASAPHAGAQRQLVRRWLLENPGGLDHLPGHAAGTPVFVPWHEPAPSDLTPEVTAPLPGVAAALPGAGAALATVSEVVGQMLAEQKAKEQEAAAVSHEAHYITRVEIENFRAVDKLELDLPAPRADRAPWTVILSENGVGKSSILKAVALALMDEERLPRLKLDASNFVRHGRRSGSVRVHLTGYGEPFELRFERGKTSFTKGNRNRLRTLLLGYGGTRLLPRGKHRPAPLSGPARVENLFDPFLPLIDARAWLVSLGEEPFGYAARAIKELLDRGRSDKLIRKDGRVLLHAASLGGGVPLEELSDGYQSMVALTADVMRVMMKTWHAAEKAQGVVLLDEIDTHLHPRWKMSIVRSLRRTFPRVQFVVTTHDPLCLKSTRRGEVRVLGRDPSADQLTATRVDVPAGATADQLLTGFWFGLPSTVDERTLNLIEAHRETLAPGGRQTAKGRRRRRYLENELGRRLGVYADTSVDRMAQSVAAELMEDEDDLRALGPGRREELYDKVLERVARKLKKRG